MYSLFEAAAVSEQLRAVSLDISLANEGDALVLVGDSALSYANSHMEALCYAVAALEEILLCLESPEVSTVIQPHVQPDILASLRKQKDMLQVKRDHALAWFQRASTTCLPLLWQSEPLVSAFVHRYSRTSQVKRVCLNRIRRFTKLSLNCRLGAIKTMRLRTIATAFSPSSILSPKGFRQSLLGHLMASLCQLLNPRSTEHW